MKGVADKTVIAALQKQILALQGNHPAAEPLLNLGLGAVETAFPGRAFPRGVVHELISNSSEAAACTSGFMAVVISRLLQPGGFCLWVSTRPRRSIFPPALKAFGIEPDRILFVDASKKDSLWVLEEALKCDALVAAVGEVTDLSFNDSRRLQLAVERSRVTGFIHRFQPKSENAVACASRWEITPLASSAPGAMPGLGFARWNVKLLKVRSGRPGEWQVQWSPSQGLAYVDRPADMAKQYERETG